MEELKLMTKKQFEQVRAKYTTVSPEAEKEIISADDFDVLVLSLQEGSRYSVLKAKKIDEKSEKEFFDIMRTGKIEQ